MDFQHCFSSVSISFCMSECYVIIYLTLDHILALLCKLVHSDTFMFWIKIVLYEKQRSGMMLLHDG